MHKNPNLIYKTKPPDSKVNPTKQVNPLTPIAIKAARHIIDNSEFSEETLYGWRLFVCAQKRGKTNFQQKYIVIPSFLWEMAVPDGFLEYYVAHELAHAILNRGKHDEEFMSVFQHLCPNEYQHFEATYKPNNATKAGIKNA